MRFPLLSLVCACATSPAEPDPPVLPPEPVREWVSATDGTFFPWAEVAIGARLATSLGEYVEAPGATLFAYADAAAVPALATLRAELPGDVEAQLERSYDEVLTGNALGMLGMLGLAEAVERLPANALVESSLTLADETTRHELTAIYFEPMTFGERFALGDAAGDIIDADTTFTSTPNQWGGRIELPAHELVIQFGEYAWRLAEARSGDQGGIRGVAGQLTGCALVATAVASRCSADACAGHVDELEELCERGLDAVIAAAHAELAAVELRVVGGGAQLLDRDDDEVTDELDGAWKVELQIDADVQAFEARFAARRSIVNATLE